MSKVDPVLLPMIRKVVPNIVAEELYGVQPMSSPSGDVFSTNSWVTLEEVLEKYFGGLSLEEAQECLKEKYPENFV